MPFPQRYGAADLPDADLKLRERLGHALPVAFGILWRQRVLIRDSSRLPCPVAAPDAEAMLPWPLGLMARQLVPTPWPPDRSVTAPRSMADVTGMPRAS